jgi:hypothetical protein
MTPLSHFEIFCNFCFRVDSFLRKWNSILAVFGAFSFWKFLLSILGIVGALTQSSPYFQTLYAWSGVSIVSIFTSWSALLFYFSSFLMVLKRIYSSQGEQKSLFKNYVYCCMFSLHIFFEVTISVWQGMNFIVILLSQATLEEMKRTNVIYFTFISFYLLSNCLIVLVFTPLYLFIRRCASKSEKNFLK